jgi:hypothetical protein
LDVLHHSFWGSDEPSGRKDSIEGTTMRGVSIALDARAYLSTSDSTAEEMVVQSVVYLTVDIHSLGTMNTVQVDASFMSHLYIGLRIPPSLLNERNVFRVPAFLGIERGDVTGKRI